jgi:hypothetical protein
MAKLGELWRRIVFSLRGKQMSRELAEEMSQHVELWRGRTWNRACRKTKRAMLRTGNLAT